MDFVQVIDFTTDKYDEIRENAEDFVQTRRSAGGPKPVSMLHLQDRDHPNTYRSIIRFPSYEQAMENSKREDTTEVAAQIAYLADDVSFRNFDVVYQIKP